jgi:hypothetical protein
VDPSSSLLPRVCQYLIHVVLSLTISRIRWTPIPPRLLHDQGRSGRHGSSSLQPAHLQGYPSQVSSSPSYVEFKLTISAVCPGPVWTPLQPAAMDKEKMKTWHNSPAPIGRIGQPSELGPAYVFLASQDGSFVSGQSIHVNGGAVVNG